MSKSLHRHERAIAYGVLVLGTAVVVLAYWPGGMTLDTLGTYAFVRTGLIGDQLSAVLIWVWRQVYRMTGAGPETVLVVQTAALTAGVYLVLRAAFGRVAASVLAILVLLAPPTFGLVGLVGRDGWFVSCCLVATGLAVGALRWDGRRRQAAIAGGMLAAAVAIAARQNGFTAVAPILVALAALAIDAGGDRVAPLRRHRNSWAAGAGIAITLVVLAGTAGINSIVRDRSWHPETYTYLYDLAYVTLEEDKRLIPHLPRDLQPIQTPDEVRKHWMPQTGVRTRWAPDQAWDVKRLLANTSQTHVYIYSSTTKSTRRGALVPLYYDDRQADRLSDAWRAAILDHPFSYLAGRFALWKSLIGVRHPAVNAFVAETPENPFGYGPQPSFPVLSGLAREWASAWEGPDRTTGSTVHRVWPYLLACIMGLGLLLPRFPGPVRMIGVLMAAAVGLQVGLFFMSPSVELRFQLLTLYAGMIALLITARLATTSIRERDPPAGGVVGADPHRC